MRPHKPRIQTAENGDATLFIVRYESPAWANIMSSLKQALWVLLVLLLFAGGVYWLLTQPTGLTQGQIAVAALGWSAGAWVIAEVIVNFLAEFRFGLLPGGDRRLRLTLGRESVRVWSGTARGTYARGPALRFTAQPHTYAKFESRHAEKTGQHGPHLHRDSFQIWLQHGERVIELAATSSEEEANAIVRALQAADEHASRGAAEADMLSGRSQPE